MRINMVRMVRPGISDIVPHKIYVSRILSEFIFNEVIRIRIM